MATCRRERFDGDRLGVLEHGRQVTDHAARSVSQRQLDRPVQILDDISQAAGNLKDN
jgi:hypothetical protein